MTDPSDIENGPDIEAEAPGVPIPPPDPPLIAFRAALKRYDGGLLAEIHAALGGADLGGKSAGLPDAIADRMAEPRTADRWIATLPRDARMALGLFSLTETTEWPALGLMLGLSTLGVEPAPAIRALLGLGLVAAKVGDSFEFVPNFDMPLGIEAHRTTCLAHPSAVAAARTLAPEGPPPPEAGPVRQARETDGLEPILRLSAAWQRIEEAPLRQTLQGTFFKRDRERLEDDPVLAGPITDSLEPLPDMAPLWVALARGVGLVVPEPNSDRLVAARPDFWGENAFHLPQMVATRWLGLRQWHETAGMRQEAAPGDLAAPFARASALLWLATIPEDSWMAVADLDDHLARLSPGWDRPMLAESWRGKAGEPSGLLSAILLGPAYQLGLIRAAEETPSGRRVVQLTPLGRYVLTVGPPPPPRSTFDHFLFVQPNFEVIAYRQGLNPSLIGQFGRFARWIQIGAALELKLTPDSVYRGLEGGLTTETMLERLGRHSSRPLPAGVAEALRTWAGRRDRVTYHASTTLVEFATAAELETALASWPTNGRVPPARIADRFLLVEDEGAIPFHRFRMAGSRDYRRPPEACVEVEPDGVELSLDLGRSDLLVDAELARFADEKKDLNRAGGMAGPRRTFLISPASLARATENGMTPAQLSRWFLQRTGADLPAAVRLLLHAAGKDVRPFPTRRPVVMTAPSPEILDGLLQHPTTGAYLGDRLGPTSVIVPDESLDELREALADLGLRLDDPGAARIDPPAPAPPPPPPKPAPTPPASKPRKSSSKTKPAP
ncbi:helicase-associated domain-containing protein [Tundrisphaera sp. TA3]|uniref:helicase-associated domain-containing protein n=1 Tax=Tundrisphaera sp. TA3 TaxID=3435775 RepID=UPI003EBE5349